VFAIEAGAAGIGVTKQDPFVIGGLASTHLSATGFLSGLVSSGLVSSGLRLLVRAGLVRAPASRPGWSRSASGFSRSGLPG
jgi:hypothetical protein